MVKLAAPRAVNLDSVDAVKEQSRVTREAQESALSRQYSQAIRQIRAGYAPAARAQLHSLLKHPLLQEVWQAAPSRSAQDTVSTSKRILYLTLRNLADLEDQSTAAESSHLALALYSDALGLDGSDAIAWLQFGSAAVRGGAWDVARLALEQGLAQHARHPLLLDALLRLLLQIGDQRSAVALAEQISASDPWHPVCQQVLAQPAQAGAGPAVCWESLASEIAEEDGSSAEPVDITAVLGWHGEDRVQLKLEQLQWTALLTKIAVCLEWITRQGTKRLRLAKPVASARKGRSSAAFTTAHDLLPSLPPQPSAPASSASSGPGQASTSAPAPGATAARGSRDPAGTSATGGAAQLSVAPVPGEGATPMEATDAGVAPGHCAAGGDSAELPAVRAKARAVTADPALTGPADPGTQPAVADTHAPTPEKTLSDFVVKPSLLNKPVKLLLSGAALSAAHEHGVDSEAAAPELQSVSGAASPTAMGADAPMDCMADEPACADAAASAAMAGPAATDGPAAPEVVSGRRQTSRQQRELQKLKDQQERRVRALEVMESSRNVITLLGPPLLADAGLGRQAVSLPAGRPDDPPAPSGGAHLSAAARSLFDSPAGVAAFLRTVTSSMNGDTVHLTLGIYQLADLVLRELTQDASCQLPASVVEPLLKLDSARKGTLPPECHLFLAELCLNRALQVKKSTTAPAAKPKRGPQPKAAAGPALRARGTAPSAKPRKSEAAAADAEAEKAAKRDQDALRGRAGAHLLKFRTLLPDALAMQTAVTCTDHLGAVEQPPSEHAQLQAWMARYHWASYNLAWQRGSLAAARIHIQMCHAICCSSDASLLADAGPSSGTRATAEASSSDVVRIPLANCPSMGLISAQTLDAAAQRLHVHELLSHLPQMATDGRHREALRGLVSHLLGPLSQGATVFAAPKQFLAAVQSLLAFVERCGGIPLPAAPVPTPTAPQDAALDAASPALPSAEAVPREAGEGAAAAEAQAAPEPAPGPPPPAAPPVKPSLCPDECFWLRLACCLQCLRIALPLEAAVLHTRLLDTEAGVVTPSRILGAGTERTGLVMGPDAKRPPAVDAFQKLPSPKVVRLLATLTTLLPDLDAQIAKLQHESKAEPSAGRSGPGGMSAAHASAPTDSSSSAQTHQDVTVPLQAALLDGRPAGLADVKLLLLAYLECVYWAQQNLRATVPAPADAPGMAGPNPQQMSRLGKEAELCKAFSEAQYLASCSLIAVHTLDSACARASYALNSDSSGCVPASHNLLAAWEAGDDARLDATAALQTSIRAEVDLLEGVHLLLNDRALLDRADKAVVKVVLQCLGHLLPVLSGVRTAWEAVLKVVPCADNEDDEDDEDAEDDAGAADPAGGRPARVRTSVSGRRTMTTVLDLIQDGLINPGKGVLKVKYKGHEWEGDLCADGSIERGGDKWQALSVFALDMVQLVNPTRNAVNGWNAVYYQDRSMAQWRAMIGTASAAPEQAEPGPAHGLEQADEPDGAEAQEEALMQRLQLFVNEQVSLEDEVNAAFAKCLFTAYGLRLEWVNSAWGGNVGSAGEQTAAPMTSEVAAEVWGYVHTHLQGLLQEQSRTPKRPLLSFKALVECLYTAHPRPPPQALDLLKQHVVGPLLDGGTSLPAAAIGSMPTATLMTYLRPPCEDPDALRLSTGGGYAWAVDPEASLGGPSHPVAPMLPTPDPRWACEHTELYSTLYFAKSVLDASKGDQRASRKSCALLEAGAQAHVDSEVQMFMYDLLFSPQRLWTWQALALFYEATADMLLNDAAVTLSPAAWAGPSYEAQRALHAQALDRALRAWHVTLRLAPSPAHEVVPLFKLTQLHTDQLQSSPPRCSALRTIPRDAAFWAHHAAVKDLAPRLLGHSHLAFLQEDEQTGAWRVPFLLGKAMSKSKDIPAEDMLHAYAMALHMAKDEQTEVLDMVHRLHAARLKLAVGCASPSHLAAVCSERLENLPDGDVLSALQQALLQWQAPAGGDRLASSCDLGPLLQHCFLPTIAQAVHGEAARLPPASPTSSDPAPAGAPAAGPHGGTASSSGSGQRHPATLTDLQRLTLVLYDALAGVRWCRTVEKQYHHAVHRLAVTYARAGLRDKALAEVRSLFVRPEIAAFSILIQEHPGKQRSAAGPRSPGAPSQQPCEVQWGLRPVCELGACADDMSRKHVANIARYFVLYARLCREAGDLAGTWDIVDWGLKTDWGRLEGSSRRRSQTSAYLPDEGRLVLGHLLLDIAAGVQAGLGLPAASSEVLKAVEARAGARGQHRGGTPAQDGGVPCVDACMELGWKVYRSLMLDPAPGRATDLAVHGWEYAKQCADAASGRDASTALGSATRPENSPLREELFLEMSQAYLLHLQRRRDQESLELAMVCVRKRSVTQRATVGTPLGRLVSYANECYIEVLDMVAAEVCEHHTLAGAAGGVPLGLATDSAAEDVERGMSIIRSASKAWRSLPTCMAAAARQGCQETLHKLLANLIALVARCNGVQGTAQRPSHLGALHNLPCKVIQQLCADIEARSKSSGPGAPVAVSLMPGMLQLLDARVSGEGHTGVQPSSSPATTASGQAGALPGTVVHTRIQQQQLPLDRSHAPTAHTSSAAGAVTSATGCVTSDGVSIQAPALSATPPRPKASLLTRKRLSASGEEPTKSPKQPRLQ